MKQIKNLLASVALLGLVGCGSESTDTQALTIPKYSSPTDAICDASSQSVDWEKLLSANADKLSEYKLFQSQCNPTDNANNRGLAYSLSIPLFTDYASKYRFVFIPEGEKADYVENEVFDFPIGSALVKTFSMPSTTDKDSRGYAIENIIETRILIKKSEGWVNRVYLWDDNKLDATRVRQGATVATILGHNDDILSFDYGVPAQGECADCHKIKLSESESIFSPIGPKARYLNSTFSYASGDENQIEKWVSEGFLDGSTVPAASDREQAKVFDYYKDVESIPPSEVETYAKEWLDINCAHCHRADKGTASNTAFKAASTEDFQGICEVAVSGADASNSMVVVPGLPDSSLLYHRLTTTVPGEMMPPLGRSTTDTQGAALIDRWISSLNGSCN